MDAISNDALTAKIHNTRRRNPGIESRRKRRESGGKGAAAEETEFSQDMPGFEASWKFPAAIAHQTVTMTCFAVPLADAPSFDFEAALIAMGKGFCESYPAKAPNVKLAQLPPEGSVVLHQDSNGDPIALGAQYRIFGLRTPDVEHGPQSATHFSFPTPPITSSVILTFPSAPRLYPAANDPAIKDTLVPLPHNAFVSIFRPAAPASDIASFSLFFAPTEVYERAQGAELIIADALNAASFSSIDPEQRKEFVCADLAKLIWKQVYGEVSLGGKAPPPVPKSLVEWLTDVTNSKDGKEYYVVYFSPFSTKEGYDQTTGLFFARYTDMYGDLFDLEERSYRALVLAVGKEVASGQGQKAANVLSPVSEAFPPRHVPPLPTTPLKTAKE